MALQIILIFKVRLNTLIDHKTSKAFRGVAIIMVMIVHFANWNYQGPLSEIWKGMVSSFGIYGVDIFFMLSGYGLVKSYEKNGIDRRFVTRRILNSYVPYLLIIGSLSIFVDKNIDGPMAVLDLLIGQNFWFMRVLFAFYLMFMVIYRIGFLKEIFLTAAVLALTCYLYLTSHADFWYLSNGAFLIGVYAATIEKKYGDKVKEFMVRFNLAGIGLAAASSSAYLYSVTASKSAHMLSSMMFTIMILGFCVQLDCKGYILPVIGSYSLYIYLIHGRILWFLVSKFETMSFHLIALHDFWISVLAGIVIGFAIEKVIGMVQKK